MDRVRNLLEQEGITYIALDLDPERVRLTASRVGAEGKVDEKSGGSSVQFQLR